MKYTPELIEKLEEHQIFVFGSNTEGKHGKGAALTAMQKFGALYGVGLGLCGQSYGIATVDFFQSRNNIPEYKEKMLEFIKNQILTLYSFAQFMPNHEFLVTKIGTNLAGFTMDEISNIFYLVDNKRPDNIVLPIEFSLQYYKEQLEFLKNNY